MENYAQNKARQTYLIFNMFIRFNSVLELRHLILVKCVTDFFFFFDHYALRRLVFLSYFIQRIMQVPKKKTFSMI